MYARYGRVFRVERHRRTGAYWAVGRSRGTREMYLDRLGPRATRADMQAALDAWAAAAGLRRLEQLTR